LEGARHGVAEVAPQFVGYFAILHFLRGAEESFAPP
jgi:hypothetical protein